MVTEPSLIDEIMMIIDDNPKNDAIIDNQNHSSVDDDNNEEVDDEYMMEFIYDVWSINYDVQVNPTEQQLLITSLLKKCRALASIIKRSSIISDYFRKEQKLAKSDKSVRIDCKSRWNSTYVLIDSLVTLKSSIIKFLVIKNL